jgi:hypothetical protein
VNKLIVLPITLSKGSETHGFSHDDGMEERNK